MLLTVNNLYAKEHVLDWKVLSDTSKGADFLLIDKDNRVFVEAFVKAGYCLWLNNKWMPIDQYGNFMIMNGFVKDGTVHLVFRPDEQHIDIYSVGKGVTLEKHIKMEDYLITTDVIYVPEKKDSLYLLGYRRQTSSNPVEAIKYYISGGHGILYDKPLLAEIQGQKLLDYKMLRYGGKRNESYRIKEVLVGKDKIHFFGFRTQIGTGNKYCDNIPDVLYYTGYSTKKKKVLQTQNIYEKNLYFDKKGKLGRPAYWHVSADNFNNNLFIAFSWHKAHLSIKGDTVEKDIENTDSPIYYSQDNSKGFGDIEIIGKGILPLVRADSVGNVHVIWADSNGNIVHKAKKGDKWADEQIILNSAMDSEEVWEGMRQDEWLLQNMCAEFDNDNNLNLVFTSNGKLVYAKVKVN